MSFIQVKINKNTIATFPVVAEWSQHVQASNR